MADGLPAPLKIVDGLELGGPHRTLLKPGEWMRDRQGRRRRLPRYFFEIDSWEIARTSELAPHFALWEFINVDLHEAEPLRRFPRYVPCAVALLAAHLSVLRSELGALVHIAANGGYRSPSHALSDIASPHLWGTAANVYRIGDEYLDDQEKIERCNTLAARVLPALWSRPYGHGAGYADDHAHLDLGYVTVVPHDRFDDA